MVTLIRQRAPNWWLYHTCIGDTCTDNLQKQCYLESSSASTAPLALASHKLTMQLWRNAPGPLVHPHPPLPSPRHQWLHTLPLLQHDLGPVGELGELVLQAWWAWPVSVSV